METNDQIAERELRTLLANTTNNLSPDEQKNTFNRLLNMKPFLTDAQKTLFRELIELKSNVFFGYSNRNGQELNINMCYFISINSFLCATYISAFACKNLFNILEVILKSFNNGLFVKFILNLLFRVFLNISIQL